MSLAGRLAGGLAVAALLAVGGCTAQSPPSAPPTEETTTTVSPSGGAGYTAANLNLCESTDLAPLADLSLTVESKDPAPPASEAGSSCQFAMHTAQGYDANLTVEAESPGGVDEAQLLYAATLRVSTMTPDGAITGLGDQADGLHKQSEPSFKYAEYMIVARRFNLVLTVWLAVGGDSFVPKETLVAKVRTILEATLAQVPHS